MSILLIRHGETASNARRVVQTPDVPLNERGVAQARRLAQRLHALGVERLCSSDHVRAAMTAQEIERASGVSIEWDEGLRERNFGDIRGIPYAEIGTDLFAEDYAPPGGETWPQFHARVDTTWERIIALASELDGNLALVTHGLFCRSLQRHLELLDGLAPLRAFRNASLTVIDAEEPWAVRLLDCCAHLEEADVRARGGARV